MDNVDFIKDYLLASLAVKQNLLNNDKLIFKIASVAELCVKTYQQGKRILIAGNGGSAADAQHIAAEFVSRFIFDRPGLPALALTTDTSMLTAIGNDYGFDKLFSRQLQAQGNEGDIFIGISTSGNSENIIQAVAMAKEKGILSVALCGEGGKLNSVADISISVPSDCTPYIQESHICIGHMICAIVEETIFKESYV